MNEKHKWTEKQTNKKKQTKHTNEKKNTANKHIYERKQQTYERKTNMNDNTII